MHRLLLLFLVLGCVGAGAPTALAQHGHDHHHDGPLYPVPDRAAFDRAAFDETFAGRAAYSCPSSCVAPSCLCGSTQPPGGLAPNQIPQLVVLTYDDCIAETQLAIIEDTQQGLTNPDGRPIPATHFVNVTFCWGTDGEPTSPTIVQQRYLAGDEIAMHTYTHTTGPTTNYATWMQELESNEQFLIQEAGIPSQHLQGFRAPYVRTNEALWTALQNRGYLYDSSLMEQPLWGASPSQGAGGYVWPHTLDHGAAVSCGFFTGNLCPQHPRPGLWQIPLYFFTSPLGEQAHPDSMYFGAFDPGAPLSYGPILHGQDLIDLLQWNFQARYNGNRAPFNLYFHASDMTEAARRQTLNQFMQQIRTLPDVWFVTMRGLIEWMQEPVPASAMPAWYADYCERYPCSAIVGNEDVDPDSPIRVTAFPNPSRSAVMIEVTLDAPAPVEIVWYDVLGRRVHSERLDLTPGVHRLAVPDPVSAPGVYVYRVKAGDLVATGRLTRL